MGKYLRIFSYIRKPFLIYGLQLLHSEFPYIWGKFYFLFYQFSFVGHFVPSKDSSGEKAYSPAGEGCGNPIQTTGQKLLYPVHNPFTQEIIVYKYDLKDL